MKHRLCYAFIVMALLMLSMMLTPLPAYSNATIWTDYSEYSPGDTVVISGSGFLANVQVAVAITRPNSAVDTKYAMTDQSGAFSCNYQLDGIYGTYTVTATDGTNTASVTFTDAPPVFAITIDTINGYSSPYPTLTNPIHLAGSASVTNFPGQLSQYQVQVDWGDGTVDPTSTISFVASANGKDFSGTWSSSPDHSYAGGTWTITVKLYHGQPPGHEAGDAVATATIIVSVPAISVSKSGPTYAHEGDTITYTITVTNPSTVTTMYKVSVIDTVLGDVSGSFSASLAPLASESKTFTYTVPTPSGDITNTVTVTYQDALNTQKTASASWTVTVLHPSIGVSKSGPANAQEGDLITYTITVTNPSTDTTMTKVSVIDSVLGDLTASFSASLAPLASQTKTFTYTVPTPSGNIANTVTATYKDALNTQKTASASWTVTVLHPSIQVTKSGPLYAHEGDTITYTITVTNPSTGTTMYKVSVIDSVLGDLTASFSASLAPSTSESKTFTYIVPTPSGDITNTVTVIYKDVLNTQKTASASWTVDVLHPSIDVTKTADKTMAHEGDTITYTITVSNTGDCPLYSVSVVDTVLGPIYSNGLAFGETKTFIKAYTVPTPSGDISNTVTAVGSDILGLGVSDTATWTVDVLHPGIDVTKTADKTMAHEGDVITYTITVSNTGDCPLYSVSVTDTVLGPIYSNGLAFGETKTFTVTYTVPTPSPDITNTVTATGSDVLGLGVSDTATWTVDVLHPDINVAKSGPLYAHEGGTITYTITVSNPSDTTMTKVSVIDSVLGDLTASFSASLAPSTSESKTFTYTVPTPSGDITNTVTVTYKNGLNQPKTDSASWTVDVLHPDISVSKSGPAYAHEGDVITYTITVSNTGDCPLFGVSVTDSLLGPIYSNGLAFGETKTFTVTYTVPSPSTVISNTVTASGSDILGLGVSDSASWTVTVLHPGIHVTKTADKTIAHEGDTVTYTITVSNTGDCPLYSVFVTDTVLGTIYSNGLAIGETKTFTVTYTIPTPSPDVSNTVTASGYDALGGQVSDSASWFVKVQYQITVTASPAGAVGGTFRVTYTKGGITYTNVLKTTMWTDWADSGTTVTVSSPQDPINVGLGTRYKFDHYSPSASVTMTGSETITLFYKAQYYLTVKTFGDGVWGLPPLPTPPSGWYDAGPLTLTAAETTYDENGTEWGFSGWWSVRSGFGDPLIKGNPVVINLNSPTIAIAYYNDPPFFGDTNHDGKVDVADLVTVVRHLGANQGNPSYDLLCDLNGDGRIDLKDLATVARGIHA